MGEYMVGTWLYTFISVLPFGIWCVYSLMKEGWLGFKNKISSGLTIFVFATLAYQVLLPLYWCFIVSPKGL